MGGPVNSPRERRGRFKSIVNRMESLAALASDALILLGELGAERLMIAWIE